MPWAGKENAAHFTLENSTTKRDEAWSSTPWAPFRVLPWALRTPARHRRKEKDHGDRAVVSEARSTPLCGAEGPPQPRTGWLAL
jgi:hypothetical protein